MEAFGYGGMWKGQGCEDFLLGKSLRRLVDLGWVPSLVPAGRHSVIHLDLGINPHWGGSAIYKPHPQA